MRNPKSDANLKPCRTKAEARQRGANGGRKSGEVRREKSLSNIKDLARKASTDKDLKEIADIVKKYAKRGSIQHIELFLKLIGQDIDQQTVDNTITVKFETEEDYGN